MVNNIENEKLMDAIKNGDIEAVDKALSNGADKDYQLKFIDKDKINDTALIHAVLKERYQIVRRLVENGVDVNKENRLKETAFTLSAADGPPNILTMKYLIEHGANVNQRTAEGKTALMAVIDNSEATSLLLSVPDIDITDDKGNILISKNKEVEFMLEQAKNGHFPSPDEFGLKISFQEKLLFADRVMVKEEIQR